MPATTRYSAIRSCIVAVLETIDMPIYTVGHKLTKFEALLQQQRCSSSTEGRIPLHSHSMGPFRL
jgi:hypothetical protein